MGATRIMIVQEDFVEAQDIRVSLKTMGYEVCGTVDTAGSAMKQAVSVRPDLVLMDIVLKGKRDGIECARDLRERLGVPVVFLTADADDWLIERAKEAEPYGYLLKPFLDLELKATIEMALFKSRRDKERLAAARDRDDRPSRIGSPEVVSICGQCKRIKNRDQHWEGLEVYLHRRYRISLSHGLCPECAQRFYPDIF